MPFWRWIWSHEIPCLISCSWAPSWADPVYVSVEVPAPGHGQSQLDKVFAGQTAYCVELPPAPESSLSPVSLSISKIRTTHWCQILFPYRISNSWLEPRSPVCSTFRGARIHHSSPSALVQAITSAQFLQLSPGSPSCLCPCLPYVCSLTTNKNALFKILSLFRSSPSRWQPPTKPSDISSPPCPLGIPPEILQTQCFKSLSFYVCFSAGNTLPVWVSITCSGLY